MFKVRVPVTAEALSMKDLVTLARVQGYLTLSDLYLFGGCNGFDEAPENIRHVAEAFFLSPEEVTKLKLKGRKNKYIDVPVDKDKDSSLNFYEECMWLYDRLIAKDFYEAYWGKPVQERYCGRFVNGLEAMCVCERSEIERKERFPFIFTIDDLHSNNVLSYRGYRMGKQFTCIPVLQAFNAIKEKEEAHDDLWLNCRLGYSEDDDETSD